MKPIGHVIRTFRNAAIAALGGYTDQVISDAEAQAAGDYGDRSAAIFESVASTYERAFAQGRLTGGDAGMQAAVTPALLARVGRCLIESGEFLADVHRAGERWLIRPAIAWEIVGGKQSDDPDDWVYRLNAALPDGSNILRERPRSRVLHVVTRAGASAPYQGRGLWPLARNTADLAAASESRLKEELSATVGQVIAWPGTVVQDQIDEVKRGLKSKRGRLAMVRQKAGEGRLNTIQETRIGANPPEQMAVLRGQSAELLAGAAGIPPGLVRGGRGAELREAIRTYLFMTVLPLGGLLSAELSRVFRADVQLEFSRLTAADLGGRARAAKQLTDAGVDLERALSLAGFSE